MIENEVKECAGCRTPFIEVGQNATIIRHRYNYTVREDKGSGGLEVDEFSLCTTCSDELYIWMQERGFRPVKPQEREELVPQEVLDLIEANPELKKFVLKLSGPPEV